MIRAIKVRLYPNQQQQGALNFQFGAVRWAYNFALNWRSSAWKNEGTSVSQRQTQDRLAEMKRCEETSWLKQADSQALQVAIANLELAGRKFFKKQGRYPRFKSKVGRQSISYPQRVKVVDGNLLYLPKIGHVKAVLHREISGIIKTVTISRTSTGKYYASVLLEDGVLEPDTKQALLDTQVLGIDIGLAHFCVDSDGRKQPKPLFLKRTSANLRRKQKAYSLKKEGSRNRAKVRLLVAKAHERNINARNDFRHKLSKRLIDENQAICAETLKVKNMIRNAKLAKQIADAGWGDLLRKLEYKAKWYGKRLIKIDQRSHSSNTCSVCGWEQKEVFLDDHRWECSNCGVEHDRDVNAAINIKQRSILKLKAEGLSVSACGGVRKSGSVPVAA